ncbi:MAG TPA: hypothetical protein VFP61_15055, partial [Acidimicrobiales bacterium]|nr:hypothetical protein [Acidimicrobiales bacterium]
APAPPLATPLVAPLTPTALDLGRGRGRPGRPDPGHAGRMPRRGHRPARTLALPAAAAGLVGVALLATLTVGGGPGAAGRGASAAAAKGAAGGRPAAPSCTPLPYQPCGQPAAAGTDGRACLPGFYDLDGSAADGCEATSDWRPGTTVGAAAVHANVVPPSAVDTFTARVDGHLTSFCGGRLDLHLTAPTAAVDQLQVRDPSGRLLATATSAGGEAATASVAKPGCFGDHSETLHLEVRTVAGASAADFRLTRSGGW